MGKVVTGKTDVILISTGIMSATLGTLLKELAPEKESSNEWNNAGIGHSALCELNYTPEKADGTIDIRKAVAVKINLRITV